MENYSYLVLSHDQFTDSLSSNKHFVYGMNSYFYNIPFKYIYDDDQWVSIQYQRGRMFAMYIKNKYPCQSFNNWEIGYFNESARQDMYDAINTGAIL